MYGPLPPLTAAALGAAAAFDELHGVLPIPAVRRVLEYSAASILASVQGPNLFVRDEITRLTICLPLDSNGWFSFQLSSGVMYSVMSTGGCVPTVMDICREGPRTMWDAIGQSPYTKGSWMIVPSSENENTSPNFFAVMNGAGRDQKFTLEKGVGFVFVGIQNCFKVRGDRVQ